MEELIEEIIELISQKKMSKLSEKLKEINSADFPILFEELNEEDTIIVYRLLPKDKAAEVFVELDSDLQEKLINVFTDKELKGVIDELFMDDTVDLIEEMPSNVVKRILKNIDQSDRNTINELLKFPEDSAGSIMTTEFVELKENMTVDEAFNIIKKTGIKKETVYNCYVVGPSRKLIATINVREMLIAERDTKIKDIYKENVISVLTTDDKEEVAKMFDKYNYMALPVVDKENRLVGIVTVDDAIDVMQDEATEDFEKMAAISPAEDTYFKTSVITHAKNRILWLLVLMLSATFTGLIIERFQTAIAAVPLLATFMTMISGTGGNCGAQSSTLIIRGLVLGEIKLSDVFKAIWKEFRVALIIGIILALVTGLRIFLQYRGSLGLDTTLQLMQVVGITLILTAIIAEFMGCVLPILAKKLKLDPAIMASPLITTIVDLCSMFIYFNVATLIMGL